MRHVPISCNVKDTPEASRQIKILVSLTCTLGYYKGSDGNYPTSSKESPDLLPGNSLT